MNNPNSITASELLEVLQQAVAEEMGDYPIIVVLPDGTETTLKSVWFQPYTSESNVSLITKSNVA